MFDLCLPLQDAARDFVSFVNKGPSPYHGNIQAHLLLHQTYSGSVNYRALAIGVKNIGYVCLVVGKRGQVGLYS